MQNETKPERFRRLAEKRTNTVIKCIRILGNCSNKSMYSYSKEEVDKIFNAISNELKESRSKFRFKKNSNENSFKL